MQEGESKCSILSELPLKVVLAVIQSGGELYAKIFKKGVLDTDTPLKVKKYICCGMKLCGEKKLKHGISLYTMAITCRQKREAVYEIHRNAHGYVDFVFKII